ncbi:hypothetical protein P3X46_022648 [Hevea brasiliensis]|uniref:Protein kinase domain-containing protein n=1 Tax=Hevea brasiliensis TaxID=3981 RepID=A0ABQ9L8I9_HEVBR|nr:hypothetical protein P3X46_022648 [Hevea brasiliensis]
MVLSSLNTTIHVCQWHGVTCSAWHRRVTILDLQSLILAGYISPYIGNLSFVREINLQNNSFSDEILQEIGYLRRLKELRLNNNSISGKIPTNISSCSNLIIIHLGNNKLEGDVPAEFGVLSSLQVLSINENNLISSIPFSLGNLSQLQKLSLALNGLAGTIPESIGQLRNLTFLSLHSNKLSGTFPQSIFNLSSIRVLDIGENRFHGNLPSDIDFSLPNFRWFGICYNEFAGHIPASLSNASNLEILYLSGNNLTGEVPSLAKLHRLRDIALTANYLGTRKVDDLSFLYSLANATGLKRLTINDNNFGGTIPEIIGNFSASLTKLLLDNNQITGSIPSEIGNLVSLQDLEVWNNQLSGFIPHSVGKLQNLVELALNNNMFSGNIPSSLGNLTNLIKLRAEENNLSGSIPSTLGRCEKLLGMDLSHNNLSGSIPPQVPRLGEFDVSGNKLSGEIPNSLGGCTSLEILNLNDNNFQRPMPSSLSSLKALQVLDLSGKYLSREIPEFLSHFDSLQYLNLFCNNFEGTVPTEGIFENGSATSVEGNNRLCGGIPTFHLPTCNSLKHRKSGLAVTLKLVIAIRTVLLGVTLVFFIVFVFWFKQKKRKEPTPNLSEKKILELTYQNLHNATDGFSSDNMIGRGSFGSVYKGTFDGGGTLIAIKVFNLMRHGAFKSFLAECEAIRKIRRRNLVKVITVCSSVDFRGNDFKALVYEFMVNGSLEEWLHPAIGTNEADVVPRKLNILQRLNIVIDVAHAIDYLHHHCETQSFHCDLKPRNILLNEELTGHVGDFGLARFLLESTDIDTTINQSSSIGVRGTVGYAPPEYGIGNDVSTCGDVYSYSILLLEVFTGKKPTDDMFDEGFNLQNFVKAALPNHVMEILDPILLGETEQGDTSMDGAHNYQRSKITRSSRSVECLIAIFQTGVDCCTESPGERLNIVDAVRKLISIRDKFVGTGIRSDRELQSAGKRCN